MPDVSVVIPTRDRPVLLRRALACALCQIGVEVEVIVVDDGSVRPLPPHPDPRVRVLRNETSLGPAAARNRGIEAASAPWTALLDDDDLWVPEKLVRQFAAAERVPGARWIGCGALLVDPRLRPLRKLELPPEGEVEDLFLCRNRLMAGGSVALVDTALLRELGGFATDLRNFEDWDLWIRIAQRSPIAACEDRLVGYVRAPGGISHDSKELVEAFDRVTGRWAWRRAERGIRLDDRTGTYLAEMSWRAGDRVRASRLFLLDYLEVRDRGSARSAAMALIPGSARLKDWRMAQRA
jgi:glycosyltransferase involved in cell wall biosynthesis